MAATDHPDCPRGAAVTLTRTFNAPREQVFRAWTDPKYVARWWGPRGFTTIVRALEVRPGGSWRIEQQGADGSVRRFAGTYLEVVGPERIINTFGIEGGDTSLVETHRFEDIDGKTRLTTLTQLMTITCGAPPAAGPMPDVDRRGDLPPPRAAAR